MDVTKPVEDRQSAGTHPTSSSRAKRRFGQEQAISIALLFFLVAVWQVVASLMLVPEYVFPSPASVWRWLVFGFSQPLSSSASLVNHLGVTLAEAILGLTGGTIAGVALGMTLAHHPTAERVLYPYIQAFNAWPKVAIAPLMLVWFGFGMEAKVLIAGLLSFFPMLINSMAGYHSIEPERIELARAYSANSFQIFWKIILPSSLPFIFAGFHMAAILAVLGAVVSEFVGATSGLGMLLLQYNNNMQVGGAFSVLVVLGALGYTINILTVWLEKRLCFWARREKYFG